MPKQGKMCRHNIVYWECLPYLGIGCAAHSDMDGKRFYNAEDFDAYLNHAPAQMEDAGGRMFERMMMGLRMVRAWTRGALSATLGARRRTYGGRACLG